MNAIALRRNIAEKERLEAELRQTLERCAWLEEECSLYLKDREVFRDVADDAEEKASQIEKKIIENRGKVYLGRDGSCSTPCRNTGIQENSSMIYY